MLDAARAMKLSAKNLLELQVIDEIIPEPVGGAHRDKALICQNVKNSISKNLEFFKNMTAEEIFNERKNKFLNIGRAKGFIKNPEKFNSIKLSFENFDKIFKSKKYFLLGISMFLILMIFLIIFL